MKRTFSRPALSLRKAATGITGFDEITGGGIPRGRTTLLVGGPGSGKTIFGLQFLHHGAAVADEPGILVAFEEDVQRIEANAAGMGLDLAALRKRGKLFLLDAQSTPDLIQSGSFDLSGMLATLGAKARKMRARRIVFDALDSILALLPDVASRRKEIYRLHAWLLENKLTGLITANADGDESNSLSLQPISFMQYMVDCAVFLNHEVARGVSLRNLRVQKYRGSAFNENEAPFVIGEAGIEVAIVRLLGRVDASVSQERVSSGIKQLDAMLEGGYYRGACVLISGLPGTAKTTLSGAFAEASCRRGERISFVSFDSEGSEVARNLRSVGIRLDRYVRSGLLLMVSARTIGGSAEGLLVRIRMLVRKQRARCLVIDPLSTFASFGNTFAANGVVERMIDWCKTEGITLVCTSLVDEAVGKGGGATPPHISTFADTWVHLNYLVQAGERNRGLSILKSRGTAHSNQVRELVLSDKGVTLADVYTAKGEVLMGAMRLEKESAERAASDTAAVAGRLKQVTLDAEEAVLEVRARSLQTKLVAKRAEKTLLARTTQSRERERAIARRRVRDLRGGNGSGRGPG